MWSGASLREWFEYSERLAIAALKEMPAGTVTGFGRHDPVPGMPDGIPVTATVTIDPDAGRAEVDLRENIDCTPTGFNESEACSRSAAIAAVLNVLPRSMPLNAGDVSSDRRKTPPELSSWNSRAHSLVLRSHHQCGRPRDLGYSGCAG
jgi:N-methylhydantoinase B/oxoprolinase/acetone carboxylase alpha subunit